MTKTTEAPNKATGKPAGPSERKPPKKQSPTKTPKLKAGQPKKPNPPGRPPRYSTPEGMQPTIDDYFEMCDKGRIEERFNKRNEKETVIAKIPYTVAGLAYHLGFSSRETIWDYGQRKGFTNTISRAKLRIERQRWEQSLAGTIDSKMAQFDFVNNFGYVYQPDVQISGPMPSITIIMGSGERMSITGSNPGQKQITDIPDAEVIEHETDGED